jgi:hypothetical protein
MEANKNIHETKEDLLQFISPKKVKDLDSEFLHDLHQHVLASVLPKKKNTRIIKLLRYSSAAVAASIMLFIAFKFSKHDHSTIENEPNKQEILAYLIDEFEYSNADVLEEFSNSTLEQVTFFEFETIEIKKQIKETSILLIELEHEEVLEYLEEEDFDFESDLLTP